MRKKWLIFAAAVTALTITACGSGDGIVINGTTAAEAESDQLEGGGSPEGSETTAGTKIEIVTGETTPQTPAAESAAESTEGWTETEAVLTQPETTAAPQTAATTKAAAAETTAAKRYTVTDVKKTMYATASVRVRSSYSTSSSVLAALADGEKVEVTGQVENGWMRVSYKGSVGYVSGGYLSETPPATKSSTTATGQTGTQTNSSTTAGTKPSTTTGTGTTPGGTTGPVAGGNSAGGSTSPGGTTGPSAGTNSGTTSSGGTTGPSAGTNSGTTSPGGTTGPSAGTSSGTTSPGGTTTSGGNTSQGGSRSISGKVTALAPTGVTVQASDGTSYQLVWGNSTPDLVEGDQVNVSYETTSSGEKKITSISK